MPLELFTVSAQDGLAGKLVGTQDLPGRGAVYRSSSKRWSVAPPKRTKNLVQVLFQAAILGDSEKCLLTSRESTMNHAISQTLDELKAGLALLYSDRLKGIYLFGSFSRGEADAESDIDILIVLDRVDNYGREVEFTSHLISQLSIACGLSISCVFASEKRWKEDGTIFFLNVREEAVPA
jgi:predicted nucleotidyltransferase